MLIVKDQEHLNRVKQEATRLGILADLEARLAYLDRYAEHEPGKQLINCFLYSDFAPLSFYFEMYRVDKPHQRWMNGGLIWHPGATGPDQSLSVEVNGSAKPHWSIHT